MDRRYKLNTLNSIRCEGYLLMLNIKVIKKHRIAIKIFSPVRDTCCVEKNIYLQTQNKILTR